MNEINPGDTVQIVKAPNEPSLLNKIGRVVMIADGTRCIVAFSDGSGTAVDVGQVRKILPGKR